MVSFFFTFSSFFLLLALCIHVSSAADTISSEFTLSGDQRIVSSNGTFEMGFFKPGTSSKFYIGMWYKQRYDQTIVWVANRDKPVTDKNSSVLKISNGNLILLDGENRTPIWSTGLNSSSSASSLEAVLLDDGNLVLRVGDGGSGTSAIVLWQSFDHPGDTLLPGAIFRFDKRTKKSQRLTSWKNINDPSPGLFSLELDESTAMKILWNGSVPYWSSGPWNTQTHIFDWIPEMRFNFFKNFSLVSNSRQLYLMYSFYDQSIASPFVMDVSGQFKQSMWLDNIKQWSMFWSQPRQQCGVYAYCGSFGICSDKSQPFCQCPHGFRPASQKYWDLKDYSAGCVRNTELQCSRGDINQFLPLSNMKLDGNSEELTTTSLSVCASACQVNCFCKAYAHKGGSNKCFIWAKDVLNLQQLEEDNSEGNTFYLRLAASDMPSGSSAKSYKVMIFSAVLGSLGVIVFVFLAVIVILKRRRRERIGDENSDGILAAFSYRELQNATKNFSEKLGEGSFGSVFRGVLQDSSDIAVKRLQSVSQGEKQFRTEVATIGTIQHVNVVGLRGFCSEGSKKLLVYDYMPNSSLDSHLFFNQTEEEIILGWKLRYQIALGTARGLAYLHDECRDCIIHCDIKPENILLDSQFCPKVADFGLAKLVCRDFSRVLTTMRGTRGYLAPEWISGVAITAKADVYSYGMMLFEVVSGRRNAEQSETEKVRFFPSWAATVLTKDGDIRSLLDPRLADEDIGIEELTRACKVACWCIQDEESHRPTMSQVVQILEGVLDVNLPPFPRSIQALVDTDEAVVFFTESSSSSSKSSSRKQSNTSSSSSTNNNSSA